MIAVYLAFGELPSWLALAPLRQLIGRVGGPFGWHPLLNTRATPENPKPEGEDPLAEYKARRTRARSAAAARELARMAATLGITLPQAQRRTDPLMLSLGLAWLTRLRAEAQQCLDYADAAFRATFAEGREVESVPVVASLIESVGAPARGFAPFVEQGRPLLEAAAGKALERGIFAAPAFVVDGEIFQGREHLPLITWMLTGRQGPPPV